MPSFSYKAVDPDGEMISGVVEGMDISIASDTIEARGSSILSIKESNKYIAAITRGLKARQVKRRDLIEFANNLSLMLKGGMPILTALYSVVDMTENTYLQQKITNIRTIVELGSCFSDAVALHKNVFPDIFITLTTVGEKTGQLDQSLSDVALHLQRMEDLASSIKRASLYPIFAVTAITAALIFWFIYVLPKTIALLKDMDIRLPFMTKILIAVGKFTQSYWYLILLLPLIVFFLLKVLYQRPKARYYIDLAKIKIPVIKLIIHNKLLALFAEQLRIMTVAGITIDRAFDIVAQIIGNDAFKRAIADSKEDITGGRRISDALRKHKDIFPPSVVNLIRAGEESGRLEEQFAYLAEYYEKKLDDISQKMGKIIEPFVIVTLGIIFSFIIIALLYPIYELVISIGKL